MTRRLRLLLVLVVICVSSTGCAGGDNEAPTHLVDGTEASEPRVMLEDVSSPVLTRVRVIPPDEVEDGSIAASCLDERRPAQPASVLVERLGVESETVTYRDRSGIWLQGCDDTGNADGKWCGGAVGRLYGGHLRDPRLNIAACETSDGNPVALAWVEPSADARFLVLEQPGYAEVFEVAGKLPIRLATTSGVQLAGSTATFDLTEHDAEGKLLRRYRLEAAVAG